MIINSFFSDPSQPFPTTKKRRRKEGLFRFSLLVPMLFVGIGRELEGGSVLIKVKVSFRIVITNIFNNFS